MIFINWLMSDDLLTQVLCLNTILELCMLQCINKKFQLKILPIK
jgi:hypothetical protein